MCELYDSLVKELTESKPKILDDRVLSKNLSKLPLEHAEVIYILILHHENINSKGVRFTTIPYNGKYLSHENKRGASLKMSDLPTVLKHILAIYLTRIST